MPIRKYDTSQISAKSLELINLIDRGWMRASIAGRQIPMKFIDSLLYISIKEVHFLCLLIGIISIVNG